jgi:subtilase family serine protease
VAVPVGSVRGQVELWVVADVRNEVVEGSETNNESKVISVGTP